MYPPSLHISIDANTAEIIHTFKQNKTNRKSFYLIQETIREVLALLSFTYKKRKKITMKGDIQGKPWF